jgi:hypothetical protein
MSAVRCSDRGAGGCRGARVARSRLLCEVSQHDMFGACGAGAGGGGGAAARGGRRGRDRAPVGPGADGAAAVQRGAAAVPLAAVRARAAAVTARPLGVSRWGRAQGRGPVLGPLPSQTSACNCMTRCCTAVCLCPRSPVSRNQFHWACKLQDCWSVEGSCTAAPHGASLAYCARSWLNLRMCEYWSSTFPAVHHLAGAPTLGLVCSSLTGCFGCVFRKNLQLCSRHAV